MESKFQRKLETSGKTVTKLAKELAEQKELVKKLTGKINQSPEEIEKKMKEQEDLVAEARRVLESAGEGFSTEGALKILEEQKSLLTEAQKLHEETKKLKAAEPALDPWSRAAAQRAAGSSSASASGGT